MNEMQIAAMK